MTAPSLRVLQIVVDTADLEWMDWADCQYVDPEIFHPAKGHPSAPAKRVCMGCPVRTECLEWAMAHEPDFGVLGGMSARERKRLSRKRSAA